MEEQYTERRRWKAEQCVERHTMVGLFVLILVSIIVLIVCFRLSAFSSPSASNFSGSADGRAFFIFGDSYADVGNIPSSVARNLPYGLTWPGHPTGRFSNGRVQSDYLATQVLGIPSPLAYAESNETTIYQGVNFAVGGAGVTNAYGSPTISTQVGWLQSLVVSGIYSKEFLASSVTFLSLAGNDYGSYRGPIENFQTLAEEVIDLTEQSLRQLYSLGLRNIMVTTLGPLNCLPASTYRTNYTACATNATVDVLISVHDSLLKMMLGRLLEEFSELNFILLKLDAALKHIQTNGDLFNVSEPFKPCCFGLCGLADVSGNQLYTLCSNPENHVIWDDVHPTHSAWEKVVNLYIEDEQYTDLARNLRYWSETLP